VIAKFFGASLEDSRRIVDEQGRKWEFALARGLEDVAAVDLSALQIARLAGHAEIIFGAIVEGFEVSVAQRPVNNGAILRDRGLAVALDRLRANAEITPVEPPGHCAIVDGTAADLIAVVERREGDRTRVRVRAPSDGLALRIGAQILALEVAQFILPGEVRGSVPRATLETDDFHARLSELGSKNSTGATDTHDDNIRFFCSHRSGSPRLRQQPDNGQAVN
jgi:hypothetical protein